MKLSTIILCIFCIASFTPATAQEEAGLFGNCQKEAELFQGEFGTAPAVITNLRWAPDGRYDIVSTDIGTFRAYSPDAPRLQEGREDLYSESVDYYTEYLEASKEDLEEYNGMLEDIGVTDLEKTPEPERAERLLMLFEECTREVINSAGTIPESEVKDRFYQACWDTTESIDKLFPQWTYNDRDKWEAKGRNWDTFPHFPMENYDEDKTLAYLEENGLLGQKWSRTAKKVTRQFTENKEDFEEEVLRQEEQLQDVNDEEVSRKADLAEATEAWEHAMHGSEYSVAQLANEGKVWLAFRTEPFKGKTGFWAVLFKDQGISCITEDFPDQPVVADDLLGTLPDSLKEAARRHLDKIGEGQRVWRQDY